MKLTREQTISGHRDMWKWIADMTEKLKSKISKEAYLRHINAKRLEHNCFLCEYNQKFKTHDCSNCPLEWGGVRREFQCEVHVNESNEYSHAYYAQWRIAKDWQEAARLARIIANLPERKTNE